MTRRLIGLVLLFVQLYILAAGEVLDERRLRVPVQRHLPNHAVAKRAAGGGKVASSEGSWHVHVLISGQDLTLIISTASADLWVASTLMPPHIQREVTTGKIFNPNTSATYRTKKDYAFQVYYNDGQSVQGQVGVDDVSIGKATVPRMTFGVCSSWSGQDNDAIDTTGFLGLGFRSLNSITPTKQCTFMECLQPSLPAPIFTTSLSATDGFLDFGFIDDAAYVGNLTQISIDNSTGYWVATDIQFGSQGQIFDKHASVNMILDSGTSLLYLPGPALTDYLGQINGAKYDNETGLVTYPCDSQIPDLQVIFGNAAHSPITTVISGDNLKYLPGGSSPCILSVGLGIDEGATRSGYILGQPFFVDRYIVWNQSHPSVSFADATGNGTTSPPVTSSTTVHKQNASSLSVGAQAGIGVAVGVVGLLLIASGIWAFRRRKKRQPKLTESSASTSYEGKGELEAREAEVQRSELTDKGMSELLDQSKPLELSEDVRHELPGDSRAQELPTD